MRYICNETNHKIILLKQNIIKCCLKPGFWVYYPSSVVRRQHGRAVRALDWQFEGSSSSPALTVARFVYGSPEFKSLTTLVNSQLICLWLVGVLNPVMFDLNYLFQSFAWPQ